MIDTGFLFSSVLSVIIAVAGVRFFTRILIFFRVPEKLIMMADSYMKIIFVGVIPTLAYNALTNILRGIGDSKTPTYILIAAKLINVVLDIFFITALDMGGERSCSCSSTYPGTLFYYLHVLYEA